MIQKPDDFDFQISDGEQNWGEINQDLRNSNAKSKRVTVKTKQQIIKWLHGDKGKVSVQMMAVGLGITAKRVIQLKKQYERSGDIRVTSINKHSEDFYRRKALQSQIISNAIRANPNISLKGIQKKLEQDQFYISLASISVCLKRLGFLHRNTPVKMLQIRKQHQIMQERYDFAHWLQGQKNDDLYYTGQCIIQTDNLTRSTDISRVGRENIQCPDKASFSIALHLTVGINGIAGWNMKNHSHTVRSFLNHIATNYMLIKDEKDTLLCDNSRIHCSKQFKTLTQRADIRVRYLPPESSYLSPLQSMFNDMKFQLKKLTDAYQVEDMNHVHQLLEQIIEEYPDNSIQKFFCQMREAAKRCKKRQKF